MWSFKKESRKFKRKKREYRIQYTIFVPQNPPPPPPPPKEKMESRNVFTEKTEFRKQ